MSEGGKMKQLLEHWAQLESNLCRYDEEMKSFAVTFDGRWWGLITENSLMQIQWAVQQAIVEKGWLYRLEYNPNSPDPNNPYDVIVESIISDGWGFGNNNISEALLVAYLDALEAYA